MRKAIILSAVGTGLCIAVLAIFAILALGPFGLIAPVLLVLGLISMGIAAGAFFRHRRYVYGAVMLIIMSTVIQLSLMEWYGPHGTPMPNSLHRHILWDLGHVH
jgi:putative Mn2+ efflux pump MntP